MRLSLFLSHLKLHVEEEIGENKKMNEEDERFHYFDIHDLNKVSFHYKTSDFL